MILLTLLIAFHKQPQVQPTMFVRQQQPTLLQQQIQPAYYVLQAGYQVDDDPVELQPALGYNTIQ